MADPGTKELLHAGAGRALITPPAGFPVCGPEFAPRFTTGVDDDLLARVLVLETEGRRAAVCTLDVWGIEPDLQRAIVSAVAEGSGAFESFTWLTCTGNGVSSPTWIAARDDRKYASYLDYLPELCGGAAVQALDSLQPAALGLASTQLPDVTTGVSGRGAEADVAVHVASIVDSDGDGLAQLVSFSCPAVIRGDHGRWTADFPGYAAWALEHAGCGMVAFARGADADVRPYDWFDGNPARSHTDRGAGDVQALGLLLATQVSMAVRQVEYRRNMSVEAARDDENGIHVLRVGGLVCVGVDLPQPAIFARHLRRALPHSTVIVSTNVAGHGMASDIELDAGLQLAALQTAHAAGAK